MPARGFLAITLSLAAIQGCAGKLSIVAFSDPNDALSYALPVGYEKKYMDSRVCPEIVKERQDRAP